MGEALVHKALKGIEREDTQEILLWLKVNKNTAAPPPGGPVETQALVPRVSSGFVSFDIAAGAQTAVQALTASTSREEAPSAAEAAPGRPSPALGGVPGDQHSHRAGC